MMDAAMNSLNLSILGPAALLGLAVLLILRGYLVPRATLDDKRQEADNWRKAYENERQARMDSEAQTGELLNLARATNALLTALPKARENQP